MTHRFHEAGQRTAVFAGSFNPFTVGHLSILKRGLEIFDKVIVMIGHNASKKDDSENAEKRVEELNRLLAPFGERTEVRICSGLVAPEAKALGAVALLRGVRSVADFEYERNMADINRDISGIETVILTAEPRYGAISSSIVRELRSYGYDVTSFLPSSPLSTDN